MNKYAWQVYESESNSHIVVFDDFYDDNHPGTFLGFFENLSAEQIQFPEYSLASGKPEIRVRQSSYKQYIDQQNALAFQNLNLQKEILLSWSKGKRQELLYKGKSDGVTWNQIQFDADAAAIENIKLKLISFIPKILKQEENAIEFSKPLRWCIKNNHYHNFVSVNDFIEFANVFTSQVDPVIDAIFQASFNHRDKINSFSDVNQLHEYGNKIKQDYFYNGQ